jgi:hypothetical protein
MARRKVPLGTFWIGGLTATALGIPLQVIGIYALTQRLGWGPLTAGIDRIFIISLIFAGFPSFVLGGGVARLCAHRLAERGEAGLGRTFARGVTAMGVAGLGVVLLCAVPLGALPDSPRHWGPAAAVGLLAGAVTGAAIALLAGLRYRRHAARMRAALPSG